MLSFRAERSGVEETGRQSQQCFVRNQISPPRPDSIVTPVEMTERNSSYLAITRVLDFLLYKFYSARPFFEALPLYKIHSSPDYPFQDKDADKNQDINEFVLNQWNFHAHHPAEKPASERPDQAVELPFGKVHTAAL